MEMLKRFVRDEKGLEVTEYSVILGIIVVSTLGLMIILGNWVRDIYQAVVP